MPNLATRKRPDYCLFTSDGDFTAASEADANTLFRLSATALEAKKYGHPLDQLSTNETPGWFPSQQVQDYLNHAKDAAGKRFFNWAILTNGSEWRLYTDRSAVGAYFAFHLVRNDQFCSLAEFRTFFTLFRASAFERSEDGMKWSSGSGRWSVPAHMGALVPAGFKLLMDSSMLPIFNRYVICQINLSQAYPQARVVSGRK